MNLSQSAASRRQVGRKDLPPFLAVYGVVLLAFAHLHFLASNPLHAGADPKPDEK